MSSEYVFNDPCHLPPVGCPLVIKIGEKVYRCQRTKFVPRRGDEMEYVLDNGTTVRGRFHWTYP